jgi:NADH-quinone oxidoreductase subunit E
MDKKIDLDAIVAKWKDREGNLIMLLHEIQDSAGYVPREIAIELSGKIDVPLAKIYEILSFYHFFKLTPPADANIVVCMGTACYLKGATDLIAEFETQLGIKEGSQTKDNKFSLASVRCIGCCGLAPVVSVNGKIYGQAKPEQAKEIIKRHTGEAQ